MKVSVIGGGSTYTPELITGFISNIEIFPVDELWLMDIDSRKLGIIGDFAARMVERHGSPFKIICTDNQREAIQDANYVITQLRVGGMEARRFDEYLGKRHGLIGQETTGVGGMAKALRSIPVILNITKDMKELAPTATLVNFTNPVGLISEALSRYAQDIHSIGLCNVPITVKMVMIEKLEAIRDQDINSKSVRLDTLGLNHLTWHRGFTIDGEDVWDEIIRMYIEELRDNQEPDWDPKLIESTNMIPNDYLKYFYQTERKLNAQLSWPPSRAEKVIDIENKLLAQFSDPKLTSIPDELMDRGGAYYSTMAVQVLTSINSDLGEIHVVNTPHKGAVPGWPEDWVLEIPCKIDSSGVHPLITRPLPDYCFGLIAQIKSYELHTVEAAVHGDRTEAFKALLAHPLGPEADKIQAVLDDMLVTNQQFLPRFG